MPQVPGLRSPHARVGRIIIFGRMLDKIRLQARAALPAEYQPNLGEVRQPLFDARCCRFLGVSYEELRARVLQGGCDEEILAWAHSNGAARNDEECTIWNRFMSKVGWRDDRCDLLRQRAVDFGLGDENVETFCELLDLDEGRPLGGTRSWEAPPISFVVVMGVSGCGKTTVGRGLAEGLWWEFIEADDLHSPANVAKMSAGVPLTDADRAPWLAAVRSAIEACNGRGSRAVVACSALKEAYRLVLAPDPSCARFVHLRGDYSLIKGRLGGRDGHFMKEDLLRSQFETLEAPAYALTLDAAQPTELIISRIREVFGIP
jgi:carbohydrate kinase (thermoresistant glucokinase family)